MLLPVVMNQAETWLERAWTSVGTSAQNRFDSMAKCCSILLRLPSWVGMAEDSEFHAHPNPTEAMVVEGAAVFHEASLAWNEGLGERLARADVVVELSRC